MHDCTLHIDQKSAYSLLWFIDQTPKSCIKQFCIFIHHTCVFIHDITIRIQKKPLCVIQFQFLYWNPSNHYSIQSVIVMRWNGWLASQLNTSMLPDHVIFVSKMFLTPTCIKNLPVPTPTQINVWNIATTAMIIRQIGKMLGVIKPSMFRICHGSNSQQLHILAETKFVNNRTAWQNA